MGFFIRRYMAKKKIEFTPEVPNTSFADKAEVIETIEQITVATDSTVLEGTVIGFTARENGTVDLIIKVQGKYEDFQIENKFDLKKK